MPSPIVPPIAIVIGASAGGIEPLLEIVASLPSDLPAAVCVVVHFPDTATSLLPQLLGRHGKLPAQHAEHGQALEAGCIYVAPPGQHLLIEEGRLMVTRGPRENGHRPAIDPLFRTAARSLTVGVIGVILSGTLDDGSLGLKLIKAYGGTAVVQDPDDALFGTMPLNAIEAARVELVLPAREIGPALARLAGELAEMSAEAQAARRQSAMSVSTEREEIDNEAAIVKQDKEALEQNGRNGQTSMFTCPDCGGVLWELEEGNLLRYRCHVGHAYTANGLRAEQASHLEGALWAAVRTLEESAALARRMANRARQRNNRRTAEHFEARAQEDAQRADLVRQALTLTTTPDDDPLAALDAGGGTGG